MLRYARRKSKIAAKCSYCQQRAFATQIYNSMSIPNPGKKTVILFYEHTFNIYVKRTIVVSPPPTPQRCLPPT